MGSDTHTLGVHSEVGRLRQVIVHRPGLELARLTPANVNELLFDDILWAKKAREEHDAFAGALQDRGIVVHHFDRAARRDARHPGRPGRASSTSVCTARHASAPAWSSPLRELADGLDADRPGPPPHRWRAQGRGPAGPGAEQPRAGPPSARRLRRCTPLPNHLFPRDNSCWVYDGVSINPMAKPARRRETMHMRAIYRHHPLFAGRDVRDLVRRRRRRPPARHASRAATSTSSATAP